MFTIAAINLLRSKLKEIIQKMIFFQIETVFTNTDPFRTDLVALAGTHASFQLDENVNHAAAGEYALSIYRRTRDLDESDARSGEDVRTLLMNLLHAARYRGLDTEEILKTATGIFAEEVQDEKRDIGDVLESRFCSAPTPATAPI
jgi:hypothetical protein